MYKNIDRNGKEEANKKQAFSRMTALMLAMLMLVGLCACGDAGTTTTADTATTTTGDEITTTVADDVTTTVTDGETTTKKPTTTKEPYNNTLTADEIKLDPIENEQKWADGAVDWT